MKNQYFGDINDYKKYSLLRLLSGQGQIETAVCWVLTEDDNRTDGRRIRYLERPERWQRYDPIVYEHLRETVLRKGVRNVGSIERANILHNCRFYNMLIRDDIDLRDQYFKRFLQFAEGADLVFFDPDNGLEVKSVPRGRKSSSKYVYWDEVKASYSAGHSLMIYQHFPRSPRELFLRNLFRKFKEFVHAPQVFSYCTFHVAFLVIPQPRHEEMFKKHNSIVSEVWGEVIDIRIHKIAGPVSNI
jgi:hypothetical protein